MSTVARDRTRWRRLGGLAPPAVAAAVIVTALAAPPLDRSSRGLLAIVLDAPAPRGPAGSHPGREVLARGIEGLPSRARVMVMQAGTVEPLLSAASPRRAARLVRAGAVPREARGDPPGAIDRAALLVAGSGGGAVVLASDAGGADGGRREALLDAARRAARRGVPVHVLPWRDPDPEVAVEALTSPARVREGEIFQAVARVRSSVDQRVRIVLEQDGIEVAARVADVLAGAAHPFPFVVRAGRAPAALMAVVTAADDRQSDDNLSRAWVDITGPARMAALGDATPAAFAGDRWGGVPEEAVLARYDALLVVASGAVKGALESTAAQQRLAAYVRAGGGLVLVGSDPGLAISLRGGRLEDVLPVRLEPPVRARDTSSVVVLVDRSGSMEQPDDAMPALPLALEAASGLAALLEPGDRYGVVAFDVRPHVLRALRPVADARTLGDLPGLRSAGGTDWGPALDVALGWLAEDTAARRHVVLVSDGRLAPQATGAPSRVWPDGVTLSTVSVGSGALVEPLVRLSSAHGGNHDHVARLADLPSALRREGVRLRLPERVRGPRPATPSASFSRLLPATVLRAGTEALVVRAREDAEVALTLEGGAPLLSFRRAGWGMAAFLSAHPGALQQSGGQPRVDVLATALRRVAAHRDAGVSAAPAPFVSTGPGGAFVDFLVDDNAAALPTLIVRSPSGRTFAPPLRWVGPDRLRGSFPLTEAGDHLLDTGGMRHRIAGTGPAWRPGFPLDPGWAERLAQAGGGRVLGVQGGRVVLPSAQAHRLADVSPILIAFAAAVVFADAARQIRRPRPRASKKEEP